MEQHLWLTDEAFTAQFENCTLKPELFSHEAHLRIAWLYLCKYNEQEAALIIADRLQAYVKYLGAAEKFNYTLTIASVKAVHHFMQLCRHDTFTGFINEFPKLKYNLKELLATHYSIDIFNSQTAKNQWLEPDLSSF